MKSDAVRIAELSADTELRSQILGLLTDPLWSTVLGFLAVYHLQKHDRIPSGIWDDTLYAGIIAINTFRQPGLAELAGKGISALGTALVGAGAGAAAAAAPKILAKGKLAAKDLPKALTKLATTTGTLTIVPPGATGGGSAKKRHWWDWILTPPSGRGK